MLAGTQADIVFLLDESLSATESSTQEWLSRLVAGNDTLGIDSLAEKLDAQGITDVRYGLIGLAETDDGGTPAVFTDDRFKFSHSQLMIPGDSSSLFINPAGTNGVLGDADDPTEADFLTVFNTNTAEFGGDEDGWDALEHAIAEYDLNDRPGTVPIFVLLQNDEGRVPLNRALTREGILGVGAFLAA